MLWLTRLYRCCMRTSLRLMGVQSQRDCCDALMYAVRCTLCTLCHHCSHVMSSLHAHADQQQPLIPVISHMPVIPAHCWYMCPAVWHLYQQQPLIPHACHPCSLLVYMCPAVWHLYFRYILDAKEQGGVARFINHSCHPNLYVQPLCAGHTDTDMVLIGLFADCDIRPFTELTYDYGSEYVEKQLCGICLCKADCCKYKPQQQQQQQQVEEVAAAHA
eukprot:GHUV01038261.1.p1 GENE.GHUV01038261.1~~GHUV01038261.1.p1  ORF type:complete len:217 (+),score=52.05 GHUV01038261.1:313-963(+)